MEEPTMDYLIIEIAPDGKEEVVAKVKSADFAVHMKEAIEFMKKIFLWTAIAAILALLPWLRECIRMDVCLDSGGRWNEEQDHCENERSIPIFAYTQGIVVIARA